MAERTQAKTGESIQVAFVDQGLTNTKSAEAAVSPMLPTYAK